MNKRLITLLLAGLLCTSVTACSKENDKASDNNETKAIEECKEISTVKLSGKWTKDYTRDQLNKINSKIVEKIKNACIIYEIEDSLIEEESITEENSISVNDNYMYLDIKNPEANRLESMYYGFKQYGSDLATGNLIMKLGFNLDNEAILSEGMFSFENTSMSTFSEAFIGDDDRDYTKLNKEIFKLIKNGDSVSKIENNVDGILETVTVTKGYLLYKLETKDYSLKNSDKNN